MTGKKTPRGSARTVEDYLAALEHPHKDGVLALRRVILGVDDPAGLLQWASPDRAVRAFGSTDDAVAKADDVARIVKAWVAQL